MTAERLAVAVGAEVHGVAAADLLHTDAVDELHGLLMEHQVLVIRDMDLSPGEMADLGRRLGDLAARHHSYVTHPDSDDV